MKKNFSKKFPIWDIASCDPLRPMYQYIQFKDKYALATDACVAVRIAIRDIVPFITDKEVELLDGRCIHKQSLLQISNMECMTVCEDGIHGFTSNKDEVIFKFGGEGLRKPNILGVIENALSENKREVMTEIAIKVCHIQKIAKVLSLDSMAMIDLHINRRDVVVIKNPLIDGCGIAMSNFIDIDKF